METDPDGEPGMEAGTEPEAEPEAEPEVERESRRRREVAQRSYAIKLEADAMEVWRPSC